VVRLLIGLFFAALSSGLAVLSYIILYWLLIPELHYERPIYFDYSHSTPTAIINLDEEYQWYLFDLPSDLTLQQQSRLRPNEVYDVTVNLHLPRKASMHDIGNVMVKLSLYSCPDPDDDGVTAHHLHDDNKRERMEFISTDKWQTHYGWKLLRKSSRPILLEYESSLIHSIRKLICFIPYCLGLWSEDLYLHIPIISGFYEDVGSPSCAAVIQLSSAQFHVYDATVFFDIQLQGIEYLLYYWFLTTSVLTISVFTVLCCVTTSPCHVMCCYQVQRVRDCTDFQHPQDEDLEIDDRDLLEPPLPFPVHPDGARLDALNEADPFDDNGDGSESSHSVSVENQGPETRVVESSELSTLSSTVSSLSITDPSMEHQSLLREPMDLRNAHVGGLRRRRVYGHTGNGAAHH